MDTTKAERAALVATGLAENADYLLRVARSRVRDEHRAEEAVQETMLAALEGAHTFDGRARLRTWLTGILLHKIHDSFRRDGRETDIADAPEAEDPVTPEHSLHAKRLWGAFGKALKALPARQADAFLLREVSGLETDAICRTLGVSRGNLWVLLHRAKSTLRATLGVEGWMDAERM